MTTVKRKRYLWKQWVASVILATAIPVVAAATEVQDRYLEVELNHLPLRRIEHFVLRNGRLYAEAQTLADLGLVLPDTYPVAGLIALDDLPGLQADYDVSEQRLVLMASIELLGGAGRPLGYATPPVPRLDPAAQLPGLLLNYDAYAQKYRDTETISGWSEMRLFGVGPGLWRSSNLMQSSSSDVGERSFSSTRLDTSWRMDFPESMVSVTLGDAFSGALSWTRTARFGGLRISRNFDLQPYRVTVPLASFVGETVLPSVVDLYINGIRSSQERVAPGPFEILSVPMFNGAGDAQMVITDITGQRRVIDFPLYNSTQMLQKGLLDWSFEAGALRRDYGLKSFSYANDPMFSVSARYGLTNQVTLEAHGENSAGMTMGGIGALLRIGNKGGVVRASYSASRYESKQGNQLALGYQWQGSGLSINLATLRRDDDFRDIGSLQGAQLPLRSSQAFVGMSTQYGQFGASFVEQRYQDNFRSRYAGLSWTRSMGDYGHISLSANRDLSGDGGTGVFLFWSLPLGNRHQAWASARHQQNGTTTTAGAARALPGEQHGWGWRVQASKGNEAGAQAEVSQMNRFGRWRAGGQHWKDTGHGSSNLVYAGASGGMLLMKGSIFPMHRVYDSFALVSTDGIEGVPVKLSNRPVGTTDSRGLLLVTPLNGWQNNDLSIDPLVLPADVQVDHVHMKAVPAAGSGMLARFPMKAMVMVELSARKQDGGWVPPGSSMTLLPDGGRFIVGYEGRMFLGNPPAGGRLSIRLDSGNCTITLPDSLPARGRVELGVMQCH